MLRTARRAPSEPRKRRAAVLGKIEVIEPLRAPWHVMILLVIRASLDGREPLADRFRAAQVGSTHAIGSLVRHEGCWITWVRPKRELVSAFVTSAPFYVACFGVTGAIEITQCPRRSGSVSVWMETPPVCEDERFGGFKRKKA